MKSAHYRWWLHAAADDLDGNEFEDETTGIKYTTYKIIYSKGLLDQGTDDSADQLRADLAACKSELVTITAQRDQLTAAAKETAEQLRAMREDLQCRTDELKILREDWDRRIKEERLRLVHEERDRIVREERAQLVKTERSRLLRLLAEEPEGKEEPQCSICLSASVEMLIESCGHITTCAPCTLKIVKCPICREPKAQTRRVFLH